MLSIVSDNYPAVRSVVLNETFGYQNAEGLVIIVDHYGPSFSTFGASRSTPYTNVYLIVQSTRARRVVVHERKRLCPYPPLISIML